MKINFLNSCTYGIPKIPMLSYKIRGNFNNVSFRGDSFERNTTTGTDNIKEVHKAEDAAFEGWNEKRIETLYNEAYDEVVEQNPICEELNIQKPKFKMMDYSSSNGMKDFAGYIFPSNEMLISPKCQGDLYLCIATKKDTGKQVSLGVCDENTVKENYKITQEYGFNMDTIKLNDKEKTAFLKTAFAHELRHCIQIHLIASTRGCSRPFKKSIARMTQARWEEYNKINKMSKELAELGLEKPDIEPPNSEYCDNFIPKKIIDEDNKLKFSLSPKDTRYLSTRDHLLNGFLLQMSKNNEKKIYAASPLEMDANNYAYQYFCTKIKKNPEYEEIRPVISEEIQNFCYERAKTGMNSMKEFGFPDLARK